MLRVSLCNSDPLVTDENDDMAGYSVVAHAAAAL